MRLFVNAQTRPFHTNEGNQTIRRVPCREERSLTLSLEDTHTHTLSPSPSLSHTHNLSLSVTLSRRRTDTLSVVSCGGGSKSINSQT
jgi:hypothetical protein